MVTIRHTVQSSGLLFPQRSRQVVPGKSPSDLSQTTQLSETRPSIRRLVHQLVAHRDYLPEVIPMVNPQQPLWRKRMRKAAFPSQRASSTRSHSHTFSLSSPFQLIIALGSRPHNADSRYNLDRQEDLEREDTNGPTRSLRLLGV
jgi:hypothetical protein